MKFIISGIEFPFKVLYSETINEFYICEKCNWGLHSYFAPANRYYMSSESIIDRIERHTRWCCPELVKVHKEAD